MFEDYSYCDDCGKLNDWPEGEMVDRLKQCRCGASMIPTVEDQRQISEEMNKRIKELKENRIKIEFTFPEFSENEAAQVILYKKAFETLWNVDQALRAIIKYDAKDVEGEIEKIRNEIADSGLLEFYC